MSRFLKELINNKLKQLSADEIISYGNQYGFSITEQEAKEISHYLRTTQFDPFDLYDRKKAFQALAQITTDETSRKAENLLLQLIDSYGLDFLFN